MKKTILFSIALFFVACTSSGVDVHYDFDQSTDFSKFRTYRWIPLQGAQVIESFRDRQIKDFADAELARKGLATTDSDTADLYIGYQAAVDKDSQFVSYKTDWGYGSGWSGSNRYARVGGVTTGQTSTIYTGELAFDMYDSKSHHLIWRSVASKTIDPQAALGRQRNNLAKAIAKLFQNYPPRKAN